MIARVALDARVTEIVRPTRRQNAPIRLVKWAKMPLDPRYITRAAGIRPRTATRTIVARITTGQTENRTNRVVLQAAATITRQPEAT